MRLIFRKVGVVTMDATSVGECVAVNDDNWFHDARGDVFFSLFWSEQRTKTAKPRERKGKKKNIELLYSLWDILMKIVSLKGIV